jgi:hypothetical protein
MEGKKRKINFDDFEWLGSYYFNKKENKILFMRPVKNEEIPKEVLEEFNKQGLIKSSK